MEVLTEDGSTPTLGRFVLFESPCFHDLASLPPLSEHFALFTAFDLSEVTEDELLAMALLLRRGLPYVSCWGEDCERLHDGEPLTDALMFFGRLAIPMPRYAVNCFDFVIATTPNYTDVIRCAFRKPQP